MSRHPIMLAILANLLASAAPAAFQGLPVLFVEDRAGARFLARGSGLAAAFTAESVSYGAAGRSVRLRFPGANRRPRLEGSGRAPGRVNFLLGSAENWRMDLPVYSGVTYRGLYPGIDMKYGGHGRELKSDFIVAPGADPGLIRIRYDGARAPRIDADGALVIVLGKEEIREKAPEAFQEVDGSPVAVPVSFRVSKSGEVGFRLGAYDRGKPLVIDPVVSYSTLLGGTGLDAVNSIAVDASGSAYVAGQTDAYNFPLAGAVQSGSSGGVEAFVAKLNAAGNALVYCTYLGGSGDDRAYGIAIDASGAAYVTGRTQSRNFPVKNAYQARLNGSRNAFVAKLNAAGNALVFSTYLGGARSDAANAVTLDASGNIYVAGETTSTNFPATGYQKTNRGSSDGFVVKFNSAGQLSYSTLLGGYADDRIVAIAVDASGAAGVTGSTWSPDFPVTAGQTTIGGGQDAFVARLNAAGTSLLMSRYLGGSGGTVGQPETGQSIRVDSAGNSYVAGVTSSGNFPLQSPTQSVLRGTADGFVAKVSSSAALAYSTYLGGSAGDSANAIAVDAGGTAYLAGETNSGDLAVSSPVQGSSGGDYDAFVARLDSSGALVFLSYFGGSGADSARAIALDAAGDVYFAGQTASMNLPLVNPFQSANLGNAGGFIAKYKFTAAPSAVSVAPATGSASSQAFRAVVSDEKGAASIVSVSFMIQTGTSAANACSVVYTRAANTLALLNDAGAASGAVLTPGGSGSLENSQCVLSASGSAASISGGSLTLDVALSFKPAFAGSREIYLAAVNSYGATGWKLMGNFTVTRPATPPTFDSMTPSSGSGSSQVFALSYSDPAGYTDIREAQILVGSTLGTINNCYASYVRATNAFWLANDAGSFQGPLAAGSSGTLQNSQCTLKGATSSATGSGNALAVRFALEFSSGFAGDKSVFGLVADADNVDSGWQKRGDWNVPATTVNQAPSVVSVSPSSGSGTSQTFTFTFSDPNGAGDLLKAEVLVGPALKASGSCYLFLSLRGNQAWLVNESGNWLGPVGLGASGTVQNTLCSLDGGSSSISASGNSKTVNLALTFKTGFTGEMGVYSGVEDGAAAWSGWRTVGSWTVPAAATNQAPSAVSTTPSYGSGSSQAFAFLFSDSNGFSDIVEGAILIGPQLSAMNSCYVYFSRGANGLWLLNDSGSWLGPITPGSSGALENAQCTVSGSGSSLAGAGNNLTLTLQAAFKPAFAGEKGIWVTVKDTGGLSTGWVQRGGFNVTGSTANQAPAFVSVTPSSGSGTTQTFSFLLTDGNGHTDIKQAEFLIGPQLTAANSCYIYYSNGANGVWLLGDTGTWLGPATLGSSSSLQSSQCVVDAAGSNTAGSGNNLTVNLSIGLKSVRQGLNGIYGGVADNSGLSSGWQQRGNWTVP